MKKIEHGEHRSRTEEGKKKCTSCKRVKDQGLFARRSKNSPYLKSRCRKCESKRSHRRKTKKREEMWEKVKPVCERCRRTFHWSALDFHHRNPKEKDKSISEMLFYSWDRLEKEIKKCDLLCASCHRIVHYELRTGEKIDI